MLLRLNARLVVAAAALLGALTITAAGAAPAHAAWNCSASVIRGQILTAPGIEPVTANQGAAQCADASAGLNDQLNALPLPLSASLLSAKTSITGTGTGQSISATGSVANLAVKALPELPIAVPLPDTPQQITDAVKNIPVLNQAVQDAIVKIVSERKLPNADLVSIALLNARVTGRCEDGRAALTGSSEVTGLRILGADTGLDGIVSKVLTINSEAIKPAEILAALPPALAPLTGPLQTALGQVGTIALPIPVTVKITPGEKLNENGKLTQRALHVQVGIAGQSLADLVVGEATGTGDNAVCAQQSVQDLALQCTKRRLVLIDVFQRGRKVVLYGAADKKYVGRRVRIVFTHTGRTVARPKVAKDGTFRATGSLPPQRIRRTNLSRYQARIDKEKSLNLKLWRRMVVERMTGSSGKVRIVGRVILPLGKPVQPIKVKQRVSCTRSKVVKVFKPGRNGHFDVTLPAPTKQAAATYRMESKVRFRVGLDRLFPTFTLPRYVRVD